jgi:hypothetical protein
VEVRLVLNQFEVEAQVVGGVELHLLHAAIALSRNLAEATPGGMFCGLLEILDAKRDEGAAAPAVAGPSCCRSASSVALQ